MSISGSLSNALSGLTAAGRAAAVVSSNISNAMTEGYGKRDLVLTERMLAGSGAGVRVVGINRNVDPVLLDNRRMAEAELAQTTTTTAFLLEAERTIGLPDDPSSLNGQVLQFNAALIQASSRPDSEARLQTVIDAAGAVADKLNTASEQIQNQRLLADGDIASAVDFINSSLQQIATLNGQVFRLENSTQDSNGLVDNRQRLIDGIAELIPLREVPRDNGTVALFTPGGAILLDGLPAELGLTPKNTITPDMTLTSGALSGLSINGKPISTSNESGPIAGGKLAGLFDVRDVQATNVQTRLDAVARDFVERFQDPSVDPTLAIGDAGLLTDAGSAFVTTNEPGLAGRLSVNSLVDPAQGGDLWKLRDGIGATSFGDPGDASLLNALSQALEVNRLPSSGGFVVPHSASGVSADLLSGISVAVQSAESRQAFAQSHAETLIGLELENGVDTDQEMQKLLLIEQSFSANARVVATIDELIQTLLRI